MLVPARLLRLVRTPPSIFRRPVAEAVLLNFCSEVVQSACVAIVKWNEPGDTLYAFGGNAVLHEVSVGGVAAFGNLKLAPG